MAKVKRFIAVAFVAILCGSAWAQKTVTHVRETQARIVDGYARAYVKPMTVELEIIKDNAGNELRVNDVWTLSKAEVESMDGNLVNIRSYGVFMSAKKYHADAIVAATFNFRDNPDGTDSYILEVIGFAARFKNWKTATPADYEWMRMEKTQTTDERDNLRAIVK